MKNKKTKRKTVVDQSSTSKKKLKPPTSPSVAIKLIRSGKRKVKVLANAIKKTSIKYIRQATSETD